MKKEIIVQLHSQFEEYVQHEEAFGTEYWLSRDLQTLLGYAQWRNFEPVIRKAISSCKKAGYDVGDHFAHIRKKVDLDSKARSGRSPIIPKPLMRLFTHESHIRKTLST